MHARDSARRPGRLLRRRVRRQRGPGEAEEPDAERDERQRRPRRSSPCRARRRGGSRCARRASSAATWPRWRSSWRPVSRPCRRSSVPRHLPTIAIPIGRPISTSRYGPALGREESATLRGEVDQPERHADPHHDRADRHQQHEHQGERRPGRAQHLTALHVPGFAATIAAVYREFAPPPDLAAARGLRVDERPRGGVIFPDGCVDLVWRGDRLGRRRARDRADRVAGAACGDAGLRRALPARRRPGAALGLPAGELADVTRAGRRACWGAGRRRARGRGRHAGAARRSCASACATPRSTRSPAPRRSRMARAGARVAGSAPRSGVSERQLRRRFADAVGYGPKTLGARAALPALPRAGGGRARATWRGLGARRAGYADQAHLTRESRRPASRGPRRAAETRRRWRAAHAGRPASRRRACPIRSSRPARRARTVRLTDDRQSRRLHLGDRAGAGAAALRVPVRRRRRPGRGQGRAGALQDRRRRLRLRARARRARADEPAAAHLDRARGARGARRRPTRAICDHLADDHRARRRRPGRAADAASRSRARRGGASGPRARCSPPRCSIAPLPRRVDAPWLDGRRGVLLARGRRDRARPTRTRSRRRSCSSTPRRTATAREAAAERLGAARARAGPRRHAARGLLAGRDPPPARLRPAPGHARARVVQRRRDRGRARPPRRREQREHGGWHDHVGDLDARDRDRVERAGDDRGAEDPARLRTRV